MKSKNILQWFIQLFKKGMNEYQVNLQQKKKMFQAIKEKQQTRKK